MRYFITLLLAIFIITISSCSRNRISNAPVTNSAGSTKSTDQDEVVTCPVNGQNGQNVEIGESWESLNQRCTCTNYEGIGKINCVSLETTSYTTTTTTTSTTSTATGASCSNGTSTCGCKRRDVVIPLGTKEYKFSDGEQCDCDEKGYLCTNGSKGECILYDVTLKVGESKTFGSETCSCSQANGYVAIDCAGS